MMQRHAGTLVCVEDYQKESEKYLSPTTQGFLNGGVDNEVTLRENQSAFSSYWLLPRVLRDVSSRSQETTILGSHVATPIGIAPTGSHQSIHEDGEIATARAAATKNTLYIQSNWSNHSMAQVAGATPNSVKWFQMSGIPRQRQLATELIRMAEQHHYTAIVLTADAPLTGNRRATMRNPLKMPPGVKLVHITENGDEPTGEATREAQLPGEKWLNTSVSWHDITWLQSITRLPIILKGILTVEDALLAVKHGIKGVIISNKGGRGLDTVPPTIHVLDTLSRLVGDKLELYIDSGIRSGTDVFKALALGARAVFIGRPILWGLAVDGQAGAEHILEILMRELDVAMALTGCCKVTDINRDYITTKADYLAKL